MGSFTKNSEGSYFYCDFLAFTGAVWFNMISMLKNIKRR